MSDEKTSSLRVCDNCGHAELLVKEPGFLTCYGVPPTPVLIGARPGPGGAQLQVEILRPKLKRGSRACSLYRFELKSSLGDVNGANAN